MSVQQEQVQPKLKHPIRTTYYKNFFLLRTEVVVNGQHAQVGVDEKGWLTLNCRNPSVGVTFDSLVTDVSEVLQQHGLPAVSNYWCEEVPLFELKGTSQNELQKLLNLEGKIREELALKINSRMRAQLEPSDPSAAPPPDLHVLVEPQLYLIIPDHTHMDGKPIRIENKNFTECMALFGESGVFDFGAVFRASLANPERLDKGPEDIRDLVEELYEVVGWFHLGLCLKVPDYRLQTIRQDHPQDTEMCRSEMLSWWWNNSEDRKWAAIVLALAKTGHRVLARKIALKYGIPMPPLKRSSTSSGTVAIPSISIMLMYAVQYFIYRYWVGSSSDSELLSTEITKLRGDIDSKDQELAQRDQSLKQAEQKKEAISQELTAIKQKLTESQSRITKLTEEKKGLETTLEFREFEFQIMQKTASQQMEQMELLQKSISFKEKEIDELQKKLQLVLKKLDEAEFQIPALREELQKASQELASKSTEIKHLREAKEEMKLLLDIERKRYDNVVMQQTAANTSNDSFKQEVERQLQSLKGDLEGKTRESEAFQKSLEEKDAELQRLARHVTAQEAKLQQMSTTSHELQLCQQIDTLSDLAESTRQLIEAEDERHRAELKLKLSQQESSSFQTQLATLEPKTVKKLPPPTAPKPRTRSVRRPPSPEAKPHKLTVQCHSQKKAPCGMVRGSAVTDQMMTYCTPYDSYSLYRYTMTEDKWEELPRCLHRNSGLVVIDSGLTAVGGYEGRHSFTNKLVTLRQSRWVEEYPPMNTARSHHAVVSTSDGGHMNVIAIGGAGGGRWIDAVELFHTGRRSWSQLTSLPQPLTQPSATICGNQLHVIGRDDNGYSCSLQALLSSNQPIGSQSRTPTWTPLPRLPVMWSTAATLCGQLVIIGGMRDESEVNSIHQLVDGQWVNIGSMSSCRKECLVAIPSPDKMVVVGGRGVLDSVEVCIAV